MTELARSSSARAARASRLTKAGASATMLLHCNIGGSFADIMPDKANDPEGGSELSELFAGARRIVVKIGSSLLIQDSDGRARRDWLATVADDVAGLVSGGRQVAIVSSGAVALGLAYLGMQRSARLDRKQAAAAAGQSKLMQAWEEAFERHDLPTAQLLLTLDDTEQRRRWLNARATMEVLLAQGAIPIINENDSVATEELRYGDNDRLSARVAQMIRADMLILLSDVEGLYSADPARDPQARHIPRVEEIDEEIESLAGGAASTGTGTGGMRTKLSAARIARACGCATIIASGRTEHPVGRLMRGGQATIVPARGSPATAYKQWIAGSLAPSGTVTVDDGAVAALNAGRSLLPAGILQLSGQFQRGACLSVQDQEGREVARGISAYGAAEAEAIKGCGSRHIFDRLGYAGPDELIHRDDLVMTR